MQTSNKVSIFKPSFLPNCISNSTQISSFQSPSHPFVNRKRRHSLPRQKLMWRNPIFNRIIITIITISPPILYVILFYYLTPARNTHWCSSLHRHHRRTLRDP
ncbi:hypothetical protein Hanom_Chr07g00657001 [Helianthus anomalus]